MEDLSVRLFFFFLRETCFYVKNKKKKYVDNDNPLQYSCLENPMDGGAW